MIIDIITPTFNRDAFLEKTLKSVIEQKTKSKIHHYIMDGGSTDNTVNIVNRYISESNKQNIELTLTVDRDEGMYDAIYKGFAKGQGDIMAWINSDDIYLPSALQTVEAIFEKYEDIDWIVGIPVHINEFDAITGIPFDFPLKTQKGIQRGIYNFKNSRRLCSTIQQDAVFWRRSLWNKLGDDFFDKFRSSKYAGDFLLWQEFAKHSGLYFVNSALSSFRVHGNQLTNDLDKYASEMNYKKPNLKEILVSFLLNLPIFFPSMLKYEIIRIFHEKLCRSHQCGLIVWDVCAQLWKTVHEKHHG
ncbi:glycosyltransferase [Cellvibrio sp.]|uniref:glycosyltransferase n=1 Tax=Cellvibrio sp. TaxID=1965322 RepID=UPI0039647FA5